MRWILTLALLVSADGAMAGAAGAGAEILRLTPPHRAVAVFADGDRVIVQLATPGGPSFQALSLPAGVLKLRALPNYRRETPARQADMLPDGIVSVGQKDIAAAWLIGPTGRYDHGVLGDAVEASGVRARGRDGRTMTFILPDDSVFEDGRVRLADLNGDGGDGLLVVRTYLERGAALAVLRPGRDGLVLVTETAPIGLPRRWLNPAAVADFDGDGQVEIAVVITPHIGGVLKFYELRQNRLRLFQLRETWSAGGFSNHVMGSRIQAMAAVVDWGAGPVLHLPDAQRRRLRQVYFADGGYRIRDLAGHRGAIVTALVAADLDRDGWREIVYGLSNGELVALRRISK